MRVESLLWILNPLAIEEAILLIVSGDSSANTVVELLFWVVGEEGTSKPHSRRSVSGSMVIGKHTMMTRLAEQTTDMSRCCIRQLDKPDSFPLHSGYQLDIFETPMYCGSVYICTPICRNNHHTIIY